MESEARDLPWPGDELVVRVQGIPDREAFYAGGRKHVADLEAVLAIAGTTLDSYGTILDFGCGCGRMLLWLGEVAARRSVHGVDIDARAIEWASAHIPGITFKVNRPLPPLDYPDEFFDLVYNHSVFTHIDEALQDAWLAELRRVTRPGGHLVLSVHGDHAFEDFVAKSAAAGGDPEVVRQARDREGIVYLPEDGNAGGPFGNFYHTTYHAPWYVLRHWGRYFAVKAYLPQGWGFQDAVLLQRPPGELPPPDAAPAPEPATAAEPARPAPPPAPVAGGRLPAAPDASSPTRFGAAGRLARRTVLRLLRHYAAHQREVQEALAADLARLESAVAALRAEVDALRRASVGPEGLTAAESTTRAWDAIRRQGDRVNRLEADLLARLRDLQERLGDRARP